MFSLLQLFILITLELRSVWTFIGAPSDFETAEVDMKNTFLLFTVLILVSCQSEVKKIGPETIPITVSQNENPDKSTTFSAETPGCKIKWLVKDKVLTHRMKCGAEHLESELPAMVKRLVYQLRMNGLAELTQLRFTTKDDPEFEKRLHILLSHSKLWKKYSNQTQNLKGSTFPSRFLKQVISRSEELGRIKSLMNQMGYKFQLNQVQVVDYQPLWEMAELGSGSRYKNKDILVPQNLRVVFKSK